MDFAVIVLSYNGLADTLECLKSLQAQSVDGVEVIVVDNASSDGSPEAIKTAFPHLRLIALGENMGGAGGNNVGIRLALAENAQSVCLLNNDTIVPPGAIAAIAEALDRAGPCLMHPCLDYGDSRDGAQLDPRQSGEPRLPSHEDLYELDYAYGACLAISSEIFRSIGNFDERFFLQLEETDFWMRARQRGYRSICTTNARVIHKESKSFQGRISPMKTYYMVRNSFLLMHKHHGNIWRTARSMYWTVAEQSKLKQRTGRAVPFWKWAISKNPYVVAARSGFLDFLRGRYGRGSGRLFERLRQ